MKHEFTPVADHIFIIRALSNEYRDPNSAPVVIPGDLFLIPRQIALGNLKSLVTSHSFESSHMRENRLMNCRARRYVDGNLRLFITSKNFHKCPQSTMEGRGEERQFSHQRGGDMNIKSRSVVVVGRVSKF
mgnify:CR=1 FL=1